MGRTIKGNLTGRAAQIQRQDELTEELMKSDSLNAKYMSAVNVLRDLMGENEFDAWYDEYPGTIKRGEFLVIMRDKIDFLTAPRTPAQVDADLMDAEVAETYADILAR